MTVYAWYTHENICACWPHKINNNKVHIYACWSVCTWCAQKKGLHMRVCLRIGVADRTLFTRDTKNVNRLYPEFAHLGTVGSHFGMIISHCYGLCMTLKHGIIYEWYSHDTHKLLNIRGLRNLSVNLIIIYAWHQSVLLMVVHWAVSWLGWYRQWDSDTVMPQHCHG